jgi:hypothetical protein
VTTGNLVVIGLTAYNQTIPSTAHSSPLPSSPPMFPLTSPSHPLTLALHDSFLSHGQGAKKAASRSCSLYDGGVWS